METIPQEEKERIYFTPKKASLVSDATSVISWVVLIGFLGDVVIQIISLASQMKTQNLALATLIREPSFFSYLFINIVVPLLTGLGLFGILQAATVGLNMLLEADFNAHEGKG